MKTKQWILATVVTMAAAATSQLMADTVSLSQNPFGYDVGGEIAVTFDPTSAGTPYVQNYVAGITSLAPGSAQSFCIQTDVDAGVNTPYNYSVGLSSTGGSYAGTITEGVAYLYYEFATGNLAGYDYLNNGSGYLGLSRSQDAGLLQAALWYLMGGQTYADGNYPVPPSAVAGPNYDPFYAQALAAVAGPTLAEGVGGPSYGVDILQLWDGTPYDSDPVQAQLVLTSSVPDGGSTVLMLGMGFTVLSLAGLRYRKLS